MSQVVTLNLPDNFFQPLERTARATRQPIEKLLLDALRNSLPPLDGLPPELIENLTSLESLEDAELQGIMRETVPLKTQKEISALLNKPDKSTENKLTDLQKQADLVMLRKARAAVLLRFRGHRLPTLAEFENLSLPNQKMLEIMKSVKELQKDMAFTDGSKTQEMLRAARSGGMFGGELDE